MLSGDPDVRRRLPGARVVRVPIREALAGVRAQPQDVDIVINCHLHADLAGGNVDVSNARILVQPAERAADA